MREPAGGAALAPAPAPPKKDVRGVQLNMDGLLGRKDQEDQYIRALLLVDGITSVTIDRTRAVAIVYTHEEREMKGDLYAVVQGVCDRLRDAAGLRRLVVRKNDRATYLEDDDDDDEDEDGAGDDFYAPANQKLVLAGGAKTGAPSAADRLAAKDANAPAPAASILGWFGW